MSDPEPGDSHERQGVGEVAAEDLEELHPPIHAEGHERRKAEPFPGLPPLAQEMERALEDEKEGRKSDEEEKRG